MNGFEKATAAVGEVVGKLVRAGVSESCNRLVSLLASSINPEENYERVNQGLMGLLSLKDDILREVERNKQRDTTHTYWFWMKRVLEIAAKVDDLETLYAEEMEANRLWPNSTLNTMMEKTLIEIQQLVEGGRSMEFLVDKPPEHVLKIANAPQIMGYRTLQNALEKTLDLMKNKKLKLIGVHGMKGVGKTTIMQNLNNNEETAKLFDIIIFITVSADQDDHEIQRKIAKRLKLDTATINEPEEVARRIHEQLENKKFLLILDGLVQYSNLTQLGIPENDNQSKVVMTAQHPQVCIQNGADRLVKVERLSRVEAWKMFRDIVGPVIDRPDIPVIARCVCDKSSGLPLLIQKIACSFKLKENASSWRAGLENLEEQWPDYENEGVNELYSFLMFCYTELKDEKKQKCFLYTSLYPADSKVYSDYLVECWTAQNFLGDVDDKRKYQNARDRGHAILEDLISVSFLEKGEKMFYVRMNDCMRQLALHISSRYPECSSYIQFRKDSEGPPKSKSWQNTRWVSMIDSKLQDLPTNQDCSMLSALLLQKNSDLSTIPQFFFKKHMRNLLVLDLYGTGIKQLPSSISKLTGLKGLYLNDCKHLKKLPKGIQSLGLLELLDIRGTRVSFISSHIGYLANLRCLRMPYIRSSHCSQDQVDNVDQSVISKLDKLEELIIDVVSHNEWCNDAKDVIRQVASLENLMTLWCSFPSSNILDNFLAMRGGREFTSFRFFVGRQKRPQILESFTYHISKYLCYDKGELERNFTRVLPQTDAFELINCHNITNLLDLGTQSLKRIRGCLIDRCNKISTIVAADDIGSSILPNLEQLYLTNLLNLSCVFQGPLHHGSFSKLQVLALKNCLSVKSIFSDGAIQYIFELKILKVEACLDIEQLIAVAEDIEREGDVLPKLEELVLAHLPNFKTVCTNQALAWSSLKRLKIYWCPGLKSLPFGNDKATNLKSIEGKQEWWDALLWTNKEHFQDKFLALNEYCP